MTSALENTQKTSICGTSAEPSSVLVSFPKHAEVLNLKTSAPDQNLRKKKPTGLGDGISRRPNGTFEARARPLDPLTGKPGAVQRRTFPSKKDAEEWQTKVRTVSGLTRELTTVEKANAIAAYSRLITAGRTDPTVLVAAVSEYLERHPASCPKTVSEWNAEWLARMEKKNRRTRTISSARHTVTPLVAAHGNQSLDAITTADLEVIVDAPVKNKKTGATEEPSPRTRINRIVVLTNFFRAAAKQRLLSPDHLPTLGLERPEDDDDALAQPYTLAEYQQIIDLAWETEGEFACTSYVALAGLVGIRNAELERLRFTPDAVDLDRGLVIVGKAVAKKRNIRIIQMAPTLLAILRAVRSRPQPPRQRYERHDAKRIGQPGSRVVIPIRLRRFKKLLKSRGIEWKHNGMRASAASYYYESTGFNQDLVLAMLGHVDQAEVFLDHYRALVMPGDGKKWYALLPRGLTPPQEGTSTPVTGEASPAAGGTNTPGEGTQGPLAAV